jgi:hypothetical protein
MTFPSKPQDIRIWQNEGHTPLKYIAAWQKTFQVYAADFPNQYVSRLARIRPREFPKIRADRGNAALRAARHV